MKLFPRYTLTGALALVLAAAPKLTAQGHTHPSQHGDKKPAAAAAADTGAAGAVYYTCPMDPEVISKTPGKCPKCGMKLVKRMAASGSTTGAQDTTSAKKGARPAKPGRKKGEAVSQASGAADCCGGEAGGCAKE